MKTKEQILRSRPKPNNSVLDTISIREAERMIDDRYYEYQRALRQWWKQLSIDERKLVIDERPFTMSLDEALQ